MFIVSKKKMDKLAVSVYPPWLAFPIISRRDFSNKVILASGPVSLLRGHADTPAVYIDLRPISEVDRSVALATQASSVSVSSIAVSRDLKITAFLSNKCCFCLASIRVFT